LLCACGGGSNKAEGAACKRITFNLDLQAYHFGPSGTENWAAFRTHLKAVLADYSTKELPHIGVTANDLAEHGDRPVPSGGTTTSESLLLFALCKDFLSATGQNPSG
jgi:hypothetical protein